MGAINQRAIGQAGQLFKACPHLRHCAFKHPTAPQGEQAVANKGQTGIGQIIGNMTQRMPAHIEYLNRMAAKAYRVAIIDRLINAGDFIGFTGRADNPAAGRLFDFQIIAGMIPMVMGVPNMAQLPIAPFQFGQNGAGFGRVDTGGFAACRIM